LIETFDVLGVRGVRLTSGSVEVRLLDGVVLGKMIEFLVGEVVFVGVIRDFRDVMDLDGVATLVGDGSFVGEVERVDGVAGNGIANSWGVRFFGDNFEGELGEEGGSIVPSLVVDAVLGDTEAKTRVKDVIFVGALSLGRSAVGI
jgi:hypothetical protein